MNDQRNTMLSFFGYNHEDKEAFEKAEHNQNPWIVHQEADELFGDQVTSSTKRADATRYIKSSDDDDLHEDDSDNGTLRERSPKNRHGFLMKHVPHREKPPQAVAKRNARERRRVQAVNSAFVRLRKVVPFENTRYLTIVTVYVIIMTSIILLFMDEPRFWKFESNGVFQVYKFEKETHTSAP